MRSSYILLITVFLSFQSNAQTEAEILRNADSLAANKKYASAFKLLDQYDTENAKPAAVLLKEKIALNYYISSLMHQAFSFADLQTNEDIKDYRGKEGSYDSYLFPINDILEGLILQHPTDWSLYRGLGDFYYDVQQTYEGKWLKNDSSLAVQIIKNYEVIINQQLAGYSVYYITGQECLALNKIKEAIQSLRAAVFLKSDMVEAQYNLAYAYFLDNNLDSALIYSKNSIELYNEPAGKSDASRMTGEIYAEKNNDSLATHYYESANRIDSGNYYNLKLLLGIYIKTNHAKKNETLSAFYKLDPANPTIYNDLSEMYSYNNKTDELIYFYQSQLQVYKNEKEITGALNFYLGQLYLDKDKKEAKKYLMKAKNIFSTIYYTSDQVFNAIDEAMKMAESK